MNKLDLQTPDNLKLLQETFLGQVKMMCLDPPYNTGNDFIYDDDFSMSRGAYQESSGEVEAEQLQQRAIPFEVAVDDVSEVETGEEFAEGRWCDKRRFS